MTLDEIGIKHGTDKSSVHHNYLNEYEEYLKDLKDDYFSFLEIGWGGYAFKDRGGQSARMWHEYFQNATIVSLDLYEKEPLKEDRMILLQGSQVNEELLKNIITTYKPIVVLEDGSHNNNFSIKTFEILFPLLPSKGIYIVEDIETSWYDSEEYGGCAEQNNFNFPSTVNLFRRLVSDINGQYINHFKSEYDFSSSIKSIHFHKNFILIKKK